MTIGRRVRGPEDLEQPGDYCGPLAEVDSLTLTPTGRTAVWAMTVSGPARLASPPWEFTEQEDGTLSIAEASASVP